VLAQLRSGVGIEQVIGFIEEAGGLRLAGVVEFGGTEAGPSRAPGELLRRAVPRIWPGLEWERESVWMGHRPATPDSLPMLGPVPGAPALVMATGGQHVGMTAGPRMGRMAARAAAGGGNEDLSAFDPGRFR
jgi:D-amino-acid dehydrogenase